MRRWQEPHLFTGPLTYVLISAGYVPLGLQGIYWVASFVVDPVRFRAWGAVVVAPLSAWLLFRICRQLTDWKPAAWIGAAMFLLPWDLDRYSGTHARAFGQPIVLLALLLLLRRRYVWAAVVTVA